MHNLLKEGKGAKKISKWHDESLLNFFFMYVTRFLVIFPIVQYIQNIFVYKSYLNWRTTLIYATDALSTMLSLLKKMSI